MSFSIGRAALPLAVLGLAVVGAPAASGAQPNDADKVMILSSPKFGDGERIPTLYTCKGSNLSPPLTFADVPHRAKSLALVVDDPDANEPPQKGFVHWIVYNMPANAPGLKEGAKTMADFPKGSREGINDAQRPQWTAPCPPHGLHHYVFRLYALDDKIDRQGLTKVDLENSMRGHVLATAQLIGVVPHE
jgi:Raf kinase inhibitor-like YbhB/YbcL family protein